MRTFSAAVAAASPIRRLFVAAVSALVVLISLSPASAGTGNLPANATERTWGEGWDCRQGFLEAQDMCGGKGGAGVRHVSQRGEVEVGPSVQLQEQGEDALPLIVQGGRVLSHGRYPSREELGTWIRPDR